MKSAKLLLTTLLLCLYIYSQAQDRYKEITTKVWGIVYDSTNVPYKEYLEASPQSKKAREYVHYAGALLDTFNKDIKHEPRELIQEAKRYLLLAYPLDSSLTTVTVILGNAYFMDSNYIESERWYRKTLQLKPESFDALHNIGIIKSKAMEFDSAIVYMNAAIKLKPGYNGGYSSLATVYGDMNNLDLQLEYLLKAFDAAVENEDKARTAYEVGIHYGKQRQDLDMAIKYLAIATIIEQDKVYIEDLAVAYGFSERYADAYDILKIGIKKYPDYTPFYVNLAITCRNMNKHAEEKKYWNKAYSLGYTKPDDEDSTDK